MKIELFVFDLDKGNMPGRKAKQMPICNEGREGKNSETGQDGDCSTRTPGIAELHVVLSR